jgi:hypothetical protein
VSDGNETGVADNGAQPSVRVMGMHHLYEDFIRSSGYGSTSCLFIHEILSLV